MTEQTQTLPPYRPETPQQVPPGDHDGFDPWRPAAPSSEPPRPRRGAVALAAVALAAGLLGGGAGAALTAAVDDGGATATTGLPSSLRDTATSDDPAAADGSVEGVAAAVLPSVVSVRVSGPGGAGEGSGVILSGDGLVLTNNHVVAAAAGGGSIELTFHDGSSAPARIVGRDPVTDLAVLQAEGVSGLTPAQLGSSADLDPGEGVVAVGSPLGLQGTVTSGIVSALNRPVRTGDASGAESASTVIDAIQTDAAINPGNSGGPLVNMRGEVVGVTSAIATLGDGRSGSIGLGFAIPVDQARRVADQLVETGSASHALLGVGVRDGADGAFVVDVAPGGAAARAGLAAGDQVTELDGRQVDGADALIATVRSHQPGDTVTVRYLRGDRTATAEVRLGSD
jgi:putative serine protease PepD